MQVYFSSSTPVLRDLQGTLYRQKVLQKMPQRKEESAEWNSFEGICFVSEKDQGLDFVSLLSVKHTEPYSQTVNRFAHILSNAFSLSHFWGTNSWPVLVRLVNMTPYWSAQSPWQIYQVSEDQGLIHRFSQVLLFTPCIMIPAWRSQS